MKYDQRQNEVRLACERNLEPWAQKRNDKIMRAQERSRQSALRRDQEEMEE
jgi:hypothetical protein